MTVFPFFKSKSALVYCPASLIHFLSRCVLILALVGVFPAAMAEELRISGTGDALGAMKLIGEAYMRSNPTGKITILPSVGSSGAIKGVSQSRLDIGLTSGPLKDEKPASGLVALEYARSPTVIVVSKSLKVKSITRQRLVDVFNGTYANWPDGTPVRPVMRRLSESNFTNLRNLSPEIDRAVQQASTRREGLPYAQSDQDMADLVERIPGALGVLTLGMVLSEKRALQPLTLDGVAPTAENVASGRYSSHKRQFMVMRAEPSDEVTRFVKFVRSEEGKNILRAHGHWIP